MLFAAAAVGRRRRDSIFIKRPAALQGAISHDDVVLFAPGKIIERERILRPAHDTQIALNAGAQPHARFRRPLRDDRFDQRVLDKNGCDLRGRGSGHDEIEVANNLLFPSITPGNANMERVGMSAQILLQRLSFGGDAPELKGSGVLCPFSDRPAKFFLRRFSEAGQLRDPARFASCLKLGNRAHPQLLIQRFDLFRAQAGKREKLKNFSRKFRPQVLEEAQRAGFHQLLYFRRDRLADARNFFERLFVAQVGNVAAPGFEGARRVCVGSNLERIFILQFEQRRDLLQHVRDRRLVHRSTFSRKSTAVDFGLRRPLDLGACLSS